jgi:tRNA U34 5-methylaminomethyl-2-thiouridine-forming methyltransferase MnmC
LKRNIITTSDGSKTIQIEEWDEQYHSIHGAIQEAKHVFIKHGLHHFCHSERSEESQVQIIPSSNVISSTVEKSQVISILEIGFGTGLNAFITLLEAEQLNININYVGVEAYPVLKDEITQLNYAEELHADKNLFLKLHQINWGKPHQITDKFKLTKQQKYFKDISEVNTFNLIYFDAFGARVQPELWTETMFEKMNKALKENGVLVTYSAKGSVRRAMQSVGFTVERLPGPPGKREMLRASKIV